MARIADASYPEATAGASFKFQREDSPKAGTFVLTVPAPELRLSAEDAINLGLTVIMPASSLPGAVPGSASIELASNADSKSIDGLTSKIARLAPAAQILLLNDDLVARNHSDVFQSLLTVALLLGIAVGFVAFVVAIVDRAIERRANLVSLSIVGVPVTTLRRAQLSQVVVPCFVGVVLALGTGKLVEQVTVGVGGYDRSWPWGGTGLALLLGLVAMALAALLTIPAVSGRIDVSLIRRE